MKIATVVVTYNRVEMLKKCIEAIKNQTQKVNEIIVINNSSTDGTEEWLKSQNDLTFITQENSGSAGGQYTGIKTAYEKGYDFIWSLDTDVIPSNDALEKLIRFYSSKENFGFLISNIFHSDGMLAYANIPELGKPYEILTSISFNKPIPVLSGSFGSILFYRDVIKKVGYPCREFFIWGDDAEYTLRIILNGYKGYLIKESTAIHFNLDNNSQPYKYLEIKNIKFTFGVRNMVYVAKIRNQITHGSKLRGYLSGLMFVYRIYNSRKSKSLIDNIILSLSLLKLFLDGVFFKPKIEIPND